MNKDGEIDIMDLQDWILKAEPRDRTHAYPLLVVTKQILANIASDKSRVISNRVRQLEQSMGDLARALDAERARAGAVDQELDAAARKIERKRARSKALKQQHRELMQAYSLKHSLPQDFEFRDPRAQELEAQLRALREAMAAQRRDADARLEQQRASVAEQLAAVREEAARTDRAARRLELERARLAAALDDAYGAGALARLSPEQFRGLAAAVLAARPPWEGMTAAQVSALLGSASDAARELLLRCLLDDCAAGAAGGRLSGGPCCARGAGAHARPRPPPLGSPLAPRLRRAR